MNYPNKDVLIRETGCLFKGCFLQNNLNQRLLTKLNTMPSIGKNIPPSLRT